MANITIKTHNPTQKSTILELATKEGRVSTLQASSNTSYELIDNTTGLAPEEAVIRRVGNDMQISFDVYSKETDVVIEDYYSYGNQSIIGQTGSGIYQSYLPITGNTGDYLSQSNVNQSNQASQNTQIQNGSSNTYLEGLVTDPEPFWSGLGSNSSWWLISAIVPIALIVKGDDDDDSDDTDGNDAPELTLTKTVYFAANDADAKVDAVVAAYETKDANEDTVSVTISDTTHYALDGKGNVTLTQEGADLIAKGETLPTFTLTPNDGKVDGAGVAVDPAVDTVPVVTVTTTATFIEESTDVKAGAVVATYAISTPTGDTMSVMLSDTTNYALDQKNNVTLTEKGVALINGGEALPAFTITPQAGVLEGKAVAVNPSVTFVNDAPTLTVTQTKDFLQSDSSIQVGDLVAKYTTSDEEDGSATSVILSDTTHYQLGGAGNVILTQAGVDSIVNGNDLPAFKLTPNDGTLNGADKVIDPSVDMTPTLTVTTTNSFTANHANTKEGAVVSVYTIADEDVSSVTVTLSDTVNYALADTGNSVVLTEKGVTLINSGATLPDFTLTATDVAQQDSTAVVVNPSAAPVVTPAIISVNHSATSSLTSSDLFNDDLLDHKGTTAKQETQYHAYDSTVIDGHDAINTTFYMETPLITAVL